MVIKSPAVSSSEPKLKPAVRVLMVGPRFGVHGLLELTPGDARGVAHALVIQADDAEGGTSANPDPFPGGSR
jgi:hypothetical protein